MATTKELNVVGLMCPLPILKAKSAIDDLKVGDQLIVICSDAGSMKDFQGMAEINPSITLLKQEKSSRDGKDVYLHYIKKASA